MTDNLYRKLSEERKKLQAAGKIPSWFSTSGYQLFKEKYLYDAATPYDQYMRIARTLAVHTKDPQLWTTKFFDIMWKGWLSPSTPILANTGTTRGLPVSCAGSYIDDSIYGIYYAKLETAMLTKYGFGTSGYLGDVRPRGADIFGGGKASGILPIITGLHHDMEYVSQGTARRGSWAGYVPIDHGDFYEVVTYLEQHPDGNNIGWNVSNQFIERLNNRDPEALDRYKKVLKAKMITGKGYFFFPDKVNAKRPQWYIDHNLDVKAAQLCNEITLHSSVDYTYSCVLASMNLVHYRQWKDTDAVQVAIVFLDAVAQEFIERAKNIKGLEKVVAFTRKSRALGLGVMGLHSLFQKERMPYESFEAHMLNTEIFRHIREQAEISTKYLAQCWGEPEWCKGYQRANSHLIAVAPTKSTGLIMGGYSEGINLDSAMVFTQRTPGGEVDRVNPILLELMKERGVFNKKNIEEIRESMGSVQNVSWLTAEDKDIFKTAFEVNQHAVVRMAATRGKYIDQWQSMNLAFAANAKESYINEVHKEVFNNPDILGAYYVLSSAAVQGSNDKDQCLACQ